MPGWLERLRERWSRRTESEGLRRVRAVLDARSLHHSTRAWLDAVMAALPTEATDRDAVTAVVFAMRGPDGDLTELSDDDADAHRAFWAELARRHAGDAAVLAYAADVELQLGDQRAAVEQLVTAFELEPALWADFSEIAGEVPDQLGGELQFRWQIAGLRGALDALPDDDEWVRERYSELLDAYRDQPERLARLYPLGDQIRRLEDEGALPRSMVVRSQRPPSKA